MHGYACRALTWQRHVNAWHVNAWHHGALPQSYVSSAAVLAV